MELDEEDLENVRAGTGLEYEEARKQTLSKFKEMDKKHEKDKNIGQELGELSEKDLENYMGGIRIEGEEYDAIRR